jgi:hypothetical protein
MGMAKKITSKMVDLGNVGELAKAIAGADIVTAYRQRTGKVWVLWARPADEIAARGANADAVVVTIEVLSKAELQRLGRTVHALGRKEAGPTR